MTAPSLASEVSLPTLARLNAQRPDNINTYEVAAGWLEAFSKAVASGDIDAVLVLFLEDGLWRDMLALTWTMRTIHGTSRIRKLLEARLAEAKVDHIHLPTHRDKQPSLFEVPGLIWVQAFFDFETAVGVCSGIFRVVPTANGQWKAHVMYTNMESLRGMPYKVGPLRSFEPNHGQWLDRRAKEAAFEDADPNVLIVGGGHGGLDTAARLKYQDVPALVIEKNPRIGDNWRDRYQALCLHGQVWYDHLPYLSFPSTWPVYTPAHKLADWLESYAHSMELNVWTSTTVQKIDRDESKDVFVVTLIKADGSKRVMRPKHIVMAIGFAGNEPKIPDIPGMYEFQGRIVHSSNHKQATDCAGKRVVVVGACTAAHDIAQDFQRHGVDVTMVQRSSTCVISVKKGAPVFYEGLYEEGGPPTEIADLINASFPNHLLKLIHQMLMKRVIEYDKETVEGLNRVGFKTNNGDDDSGFLMMAWQRGGGYYLDVGASQLIIDGKIKLKSGSVKSFTTDSLVFEDGSALKADLVVFATGLGDVRVPLEKLMGETLVSRLSPIWGLTNEGEIRGVWTVCGVPNFYYMMGNLALCRFHSTHTALQIKAVEAGLSTTPYYD
ncbi:hypothetical protein JB92DRAFT_2705437 [Gautieria morchelliformis]|nr:hypothetical protein JB92DRAFT_2705437 [Gautieria morchelliformis]